MTLECEGKVTLFVETVSCHGNETPESLSCKSYAKIRQIRILGQESQHPCILDGCQRSVLQAGMVVDIN